MFRLRPLVGLALLAFACGQESVLTLSAKRTRRTSECPPLRRAVATPKPAPPVEQPRVDGKDGHGGVAMDWAAQKAQLAAWVQGPAPRRAVFVQDADGVIHRMEAPSPFANAGPALDGFEAHRGVDGPGSVRAEQFMMMGDDMASRLGRAADWAKLPEPDRLKQAKDVYLRGYSLRNNDPEGAMRLFRDVVAMTPPSNEYHQKARARLEELER